MSHHRDDVLAGSSLTGDAPPGDALVLPATILAAGGSHDAPRGNGADPSGCITCSDALLEVRVERVSEDGTWADGTCAGERCSVSVELVAGVRPGDVVLAQGGVALQLREAAP